MSAVPAGFDAAAYLRQNPDVAAAGMDAAQHYEQYGRFEGRAAPTIAPQSTAPAAPKVKPIKPVFAELGEGELMSQQAPLLDVTTDVSQVSTPTDVTVPEPITPTTVEPVTVSEEDLGTAEAAVGEVSPEALVGDIQGTVSAESLVDAAQGTVSPEATVKYQLAELYASIEEGEPLPPWAAPAVRAVGGVMAKRGLGASSMASAAMVQAVMESAIPIAAQDAQTYATIDLTNLNNRQQAALQNAATYAAMDRANLDARLQAAVTNAQSFLAIDLQNLTNDQRTRELNYQSNVQRMFTNQAAENAAAQFNAQTENQVEMFFTELATQVETANANRSAAAEQFNVAQANAMAQFNTSINNSRDQFNASMSMQVEQSNVEWRRQLNTQNTAIANQAIQFNAEQAFQSTQAQIAQQWQQHRDELAWAFTSAENELARQHELTLYALQQANTLELMDEEVENDVWRRIGERIVDRII
jgi:hypothetical protein